jgi:HK97 family phage major capsid protein
MTNEELMVNLQTELKTFREKSDAEAKANKAVSDETAKSVLELLKRIDELDVKMSKPREGGAPDLGTHLREQKELQSVIGKNFRGSVRFDIPRHLLERKTTITTATLGFPTPGVMPQEAAGFVQEARANLPMRSVIPVRATTAAQIFWPTMMSGFAGSKASPQTEGSVKAANNWDAVTSYENVRTIATYLKVSKQALDDWTELQGLLEGNLRYKVNAEEDTQILFGDGSGVNLHSLTHQAQSWDLTLLTASDGYEYIDMIGGALQQIEEDNEVAGTFIVLNPGDAWKIRRQKDSTGRYMIGDPTGAAPFTLWGRPVVTTSIMTKGYFLVGAGTPNAVELREKMGVTVELSTEDADNFTYNLVTIRAESRLALCVYRPDAFVYGALTQSPA